MNNANEVSQSITYKLLIFVAHFSQKKLKILLASAILCFYSLKHIVLCLCKTLISLSGDIKTDPGSQCPNQNKSPSI